MHVTRFSARTVLYSHSELQTSKLKIVNFDCQIQDGALPKMFSENVNCEVTNHVYTVHYILKLFL